jgi:thiol-disulfide isomerase/thioredoxin
MKKLILLIVFSSLSFLVIAGAPLKNYEVGEFSKILKKYPNQKLVIHYWGTTCAPCLTELPDWGKFLKSEKGLKVIFVQVDNASEKMMHQRIKLAEIDKFEHYHLTGNFDEFIYYEVDRKWHGEIPMTLLINADGTRQKILGSVDFKDLRKWAKM